MEQIALDEQIVRKYLLGELSEDSYEQIETRLLTDNEFFESLLTLEDVVEDVLIDEYVSGELAGREREGFEQIFLSTPERREKLELARDLNRYVALKTADSQIDTRPSTKPSWWPSLSFLSFQNSLVRFSLVAALLLMTIGCFWLFFKVRRLETELGQLRAQQQNPPAQEQNLREQLEHLRERNDELAANLRQAEEQRTRLEQELASLKEQERRKQDLPTNIAPTQSQTPVVSIVLPLLRSRGSEAESTPVLNLPPGLRRVRLILSLDTIDPKDYKSYQVIVKKRGGPEVWDVKKVDARTKGGQNQIVLLMPAQRLSDGEYNVELQGFSNDGQTEFIGIYAFRVLGQ